MFRNYLKTAIRNLSRNRIYSLINIAGLSIGLACAMLILLYVKDEASFDRFHKNAKNIYRVVQKSKYKGHEYKNAVTGILQGPRFSQHIPGIRSFLRISRGTEDIQKGSDVQAQDVLYVDSSFFTLFSFPLLNGDVNSCLTDPHSVVMSEDAAKRQFGKTDAVGKILMIKEDSVFAPYKVTAVAKRCPQNSSVQFDVLMPLKVSAAEAADNNNWFSFYLNTFVLLEDKASRETVEKQMQEVYLKDATQTYNEMSKKYGFGDESNIGTYYLQPCLDIHLDTELPAQNGTVRASNPVYTYILSGIALFVLLIACINFVNLTIARSVKRAKEIGIRKVVGGDRRQLILQFLGESFILCAAAFALAILLVQFLLPLFDELADKTLSISYLFDDKLIAYYLALFVITGFLAGFYPALVLSGYNPVQTLYSRFTISGKSNLQKSLVVLQFALASFLIMATLTIYRQFDLLTKTDLGYDDSNLVLVDKHHLKHTDAALFKNELIKSPNITGVSAKNEGLWITGAKTSADSIINFQNVTIDENYLPLLKIPLVAGRNFSSSFPSDSTQSVIVNESFVKAAHWKKPIGQSVNFWWNNNETYHVIGVVKDYHFESMTQKLMPELFSMKNGNWYGTYCIKIKPNSAAESLKWIQKLFSRFYPMDPYAYRFKDAENLKEYESVSKWKQILLFGAVLTIFISCIGLFGLSVLSAEKRTKEIGIRKVLGASVKHIVAILSTDFVKLTLIALAIASPLAYLAAVRWLDNFPYRITLSWRLYFYSGMIVVIIALATVSFQALKTAIANPVKSLRTD